MTEAGPGQDPNRPTPSRLYKYKPLTDETSRERLRSILVNSRIYFPSRRDFNDPYDCLFPPFHNVKRKELERFARQELKKGLPGGEAKVRARTIDFHQLRNYIQGKLDKVGILSLTERPENLLMWAHYSSSHTDVCLEFAASEYPLSGYENFFGRPQPVIYSEKRPKINLNGRVEDIITPHF